MIAALNRESHIIVLYNYKPHLQLQTMALAIRS